MQSRHHWQHKEQLHLLLLSIALKELKLKNVSKYLKDSGSFWRRLWGLRWTSWISVGGFLRGQQCCCLTLGLRRPQLCSLHKPPPASASRRPVRGWSAWPRCHDSSRSAGLWASTTHPHGAADQMSHDKAATYVTSSLCFLSFPPSPSSAPTCRHWRSDEARWKTSRPSKLNPVVLAVKNSFVDTI